MGNKQLDKLNLGCGTDIWEGYLNVDIVPFQGVDMVWDLNETPLPFKDDSFSEILLITFSSISMIS